MCVFEPPPVPEPAPVKEPAPFKTPADSSTNAALASKRSGTSSLRVDLDVPKVQSGLMIP